MMKYLFVGAILLGLLWVNNCNAQGADSTKIIKSLTRCWHAFSHEYATIYGLEEEEIKDYSNQKVCFSRDSVSIYYGFYYDPKYSIKNVNAEDYAKNNFDCSKRKLGILIDSVFEITVSSVSRPSHNGPVRKMTNVVAFDGECVYTLVDGVIFKLVDADNKVQPRSSN